VNVRHSYLKETKVIEPSTHYSNILTYCTFKWTKIKKNLQEQENSLKKLQNYQKRKWNNTKSNIICIIAPCSPYFPFFRTGMINWKIRLWQFCHNIWLLLYNQSGCFTFSKINLCKKSMMLRLIWEARKKQSWTTESTLLQRVWALGLMESWFVFWEIK
jgi:hypothetical protein